MIARLRIGPLLTIIVVASLFFTSIILLRYDKSYILTTNRSCAIPPHSSSSSFGSASLRVGIVMLDTRIRVRTLFSDGSSSCSGPGLPIHSVANEKYCLSYTTAKPEHDYIDWAILQNHKYASCHGYDFIVSDSSFRQRLNGTQDVWSKIWTLRNSGLTLDYDLLLMLDSDAIFVNVSWSVQDALETHAPGWLANQTKLLLYSQDAGADFEKAFGYGGNAGVLLFKTARHNATMHALLHSMLDYWWDNQEPAAQIWYHNYPMEQALLNKFIATDPRFGPSVQMVKRWPGEEWSSPMYGDLRPNQFIAHLTSGWGEPRRTEHLRRVALESSTVDCSSTLGAGACSSGDVLTPNWLHSLEYDMAQSNEKHYKLENIWRESK